MVTDILQIVETYDPDEAQMQLVMRGDELFLPWTCSMFPRSLSLILTYNLFLPIAHILLFSLPDIAPTHRVPRVPGLLPADPRRRPCVREQVQRALAAVHAGPAQPAQQGRVRPHPRRLPLLQELRPGHLLEGGRRWG